MPAAHNKSTREMAANYWESTQFRRWLLSKDELARRRGCGSDEELERVVRPHLVAFAYAMGHKLRFQSRVSATAATYVNRFYVSTRMRDADPRHVVPASVYLAAKVEEMGQYRPQVIIDTVHRVAVGEFAVFASSIDAAALLESELLVLERLEFDLVVFHPYHDLDKYAADAAVPNLVAVAGMLVNDAQRCDVALVYPPFIVALAALYLAGVHARVDVKPWFDHLNVNVAEVRACAKDMLDAYAGETELKAQLPSAWNALLHAAPS